MNPQFILIGILVVPVILITLLRVNAALVFLSVCLGAVLVQFVAPDAATIIASTSAHQPGALSSQANVNLLLQLLPVALTMLIMIRSVKGRGKLLLNILPALGVGALLALLVVPLLSSGLTSGIFATQLWRELQSLQTLVVGASTLLALLSLAVQRPKHHADLEK